MMIMQAFLISELDLDQQLPFSASIVFEQSYGEVDGDSASLAELCALISALSQQPITQQIAVTGSVDQFGNVQPIGGANEKIEGFFEVCLRRGLTGKQGVILPASNVRHLCLRPDVVEAVRVGQFHLWAVDSVAEALPLLTGYPFAEEQQPSLLAAIQERIAQAMLPERRPLPWPLRWLNWFSRG
jgi:Lon-like ATP-dependent protease